MTRLGLTRSLFDPIDPEPSLFGPEERDQLDDIAEQSTEADAAAGRELTRWARS